MLTVVSNDVFPTEQSFINFNQKFNMVDDEEVVDKLLEELEDLDFLVEVEDSFGSDIICQQKSTGRIIFTERNCGGHTRSLGPVDKKDVLDYFS